MTNLLKTLTLTSAPSRGSDPVVRRREKLAERIREQIALCKNPDHVRTERKREKGDDGNVHVTNVMRHVHPWWSGNPDAGTTHLTVRYANRRIDLSPGKPVVAVPKGKLVETLEVLASAVSAGELDEAISKVAPTGIGKKERPKKRAA